MRSDREEIPAPFTKEDADKAETMEARQRMSRAAVGCQTYWPSPYEVCGVIRDKYNSLGGPGSFLSFPKTNELTNPGNTGKRSEFLNGPIYWSAASGAHPVVNSFLFRWQQLGYESANGMLGYPTTDEIVLPDGGRRQEFQRGVIYVAFQNAVGSALRNGLIRDKYNTVGGLAPGGSLLGYPIQDPVDLPDGQGRMNRFEHGVIYWHPVYGAHIVRGFMLEEWARNGYEAGRYGYPLGEESGLGLDTVQNFQKKKMTWLQNVAGVHEFIFQPQDPTYIDGDEVGNFSGQVQYASAPDRYPMAWGLRMSALVEATAANGGATPMKCDAYRNENGRPTEYHYDKSSPGSVPITVDYPLHSTISNNRIGASESLFGYCSFEDKSGGFSFVTWSFDYSVLDYNLPPPGGA